MSDTMIFANVVIKEDRILFLLVPLLAVGIGIVWYQLRRPTTALSCLEPVFIEYAVKFFSRAHAIPEDKKDVGKNLTALYIEDQLTEVADSFSVRHKKHVLLTERSVCAERIVEIMLERKLITFPVTARQGSA